MKKLLNLLTVFSLVFFYSCDQNSDFDADDLLTGDASLGGALVDIRSYSEGKLLGVPSSTDLPNAQITFSDNMLDLEIFLVSGGQNVSSYEIVKSFNGGNEVTVATSNTLPINLTYSSTTEFLNEFGMTEDQLRIGDVFTFRTKIVHNDGRTLFAGPNDGTYKVTVSCSSNLSGNYNLTVVRDDGASWDRPGEVVTEVGVGEYKTTTTGGWNPGQYTDDQGYTFTDVCGSLNIPNQDLFQGTYSNDVEGTEPGSVNSVTGDFVTKYSVILSGSPVGYTGTYVKI